LRVAWSSVLAGRRRPWPAPGTPTASYDQAGIAVGVEAVARIDGVPVGLRDQRAPGEGRDEHEERRAREVKVRHEGVDDLEGVARPWGPPRTRSAARRPSDSVRDRTRSGWRDARCRAEGAAVPAGGASRRLSRPHAPRAAHPPHRRPRSSAGLARTRPPPGGRRRDTVARAARA